MSKNYALRLEEFEDVPQFEQIKKKSGEDNKKKRTRKSKHRENYVDPLDIKWDTDID